MGGDNMGLLVDENVEVQITRRNRKYYREKGYNIPDCYEGNFAIKSIDINPKSKIAMLPFICDCCGKKFYRSAQNYYKRNHFDDALCKDCYHIHTQESMQEKYGVKSYSQAKDYRDKVKTTCQEKYGTDHYTQTKEFHQRVVQTCKEKYGVDSYTKTPEFREKAKTLFRNNGLVCSSKAQRRICELVDGQLNYYCHGFYLDVLFEDWLDIEYDGSGHDLRVKCGKISQTEFNQKERKRIAAIHHHGYKTLIIKGNDRDRLPSDNILYTDIYKAIDYLRNNKAKTFEIDYTKLQ